MEPVESLIAAASAPTTVKSPSAPSTTAPGSVITIYGGPNATANIPGPHNDGADFYGIAAALAAILVAIAVTRLVFRRSGRPAPDAEGPR
jgi:hypothetical protein